MTAPEIHKHLKKLANPDKAKILQGFFKTGPGEYGEGDRFLGIVVPVIRKLVKQYKDTHVGEVGKLLKSAIHEERLLSLLLLVRKFEKGDDGLRKRIYDLYVKSTKYINNWDLVDLSAEKIVGPYLKDRARRPLYRLAKSKILWERRIAVISTFHYIKDHDYRDALAVAGLLLDDAEDLIHKAVGWMLREVGKRDRGVEERFLRAHYRSMPRTMLRYAIERFPESKRKKYLNGKV
jgi:3-methyladenine DNA glycosylase AlkD